MGWDRIGNNNKDAGTSNGLLLPTEGKLTVNLYLCMSRKSVGEVEKLAVNKD